MSVVTIREILAKLTEKQYDVLTCLLFDISYKATAKTLNISNRTVEGHANAIFRKAGVNNKNDLIRLIKQKGDEAINKQLETHFLELTKNKHYFSQQKRINQYIFFGVILLCFGCSFFMISKDTKNEVFHKVNNSVYLLNRDDLLKKLKKRSEQLDIKIIFGHGGAGKTTLAREYLRRSRCAIAYEIRAESFDALNEGITGLAYTLAKTKEQRENLSFLNGIRDPHEKLRQFSAFVYSNLKDIKDWCILFDNVDNFKLLTQNCIDVIPFIEQMHNGQILITTRDYMTDKYFPNADKLEIGELTAREKEQLFSKITGQKPNNIIKEYLNDIPNYPLDVSCCAYYIKNVHISLQEYLRRMRSESDSFWNSNKKIISENTDYSSTRKEIISALLDQLININPEFKKLLFAITLMDSQNIPINFLENIYTSTLLDELIFHLTKFGISTFSEASISFHRSTFAHMLEYFHHNLSEREKLNVVRKVVTAITPYEKLCLKELDFEKLIPHFKNIAKNLKMIKQTEDLRMQLLISIGFLIKERYISAIEAVPYFDNALKIDNNIKHLSKRERNNILLAAGEACLISNENTKALEYLKRSFVSYNFVGKDVVNYAKNYNLIGVVFMRNKSFDAANINFDHSLKILKNISEQQVDTTTKFTIASIYLNKGLNYYLHYINKPQMKEAIKIMEKAIEAVSQDLGKEEAIKITATAKIRIAGVFNSLQEYKKALLLVNEAEELLNKLSSKDNNYYCSLGLILMEQGHAILRLNNLRKAREILDKAHKIADKTMIGDHVYRVRMQEAEVLIRLGEYEKAYNNCLDVFAKKNKERNNYNELFFGTAYYNAAVVKYKIAEFDLALKHFQDFTKYMSVFCKNFLPTDDYLRLLNANVFEIITDKRMLKKCFKNALCIYSTACMKGSEFITDYVQKNYEMCK